jgi:hypothetical protein
MNIKQTILTAILFMTVSIAYSQVKNEYSIENIENLQEFEILTTKESRIHERSQKKYKRVDHRYKVDSLFQPTTSDARKKLLYEYKLKKRVNFKENRSRFFVDYIQDDSIIINKTYRDSVPVSTQCLCVLKNDSIYISMGLSMLSGFFYDIRLHENTYTLNYHETDFGLSMYKYSLKDASFLDKVSLPVTNSSLTFEKPIELAMGAEITGYLKFETPKYYLALDYEDNTLWRKLDEIEIKGNIVFTCKLREPLEPLNKGVGNK